MVGRELPHRGGGIRRRWSGGDGGGRVVGVAPGGHAQVDTYFAGPLGVTVSGNMDWIGGRSAVLPGGIAAMLVAGPVLRWSDK
jgi:hypothetical protein